MRWREFLVQWAEKLLPAGTFRKTHLPRRPFDSQLVDAWLGRSDCISAWRRCRCPLDTFDRIPEDPGNAAIAFDLGQLFVQGRLEDAETTSKAAVATTPDNQDLRITRAVVLLR